MLEVVFKSRIFLVTEISMLESKSLNLYSSNLSC